MSLEKSNLFHVILREEVNGAPDEKNAALRRLLKIADTHDFDTRRFERHGILSLSIHDPAKVEAIRRDPGVEEVEPEGVKHAI